MISRFDYTYVFLCIACALVRLGHRVCHLLFLNGLTEARFEKRATRLTGYGLCHDGNTNPDFYRGTLFDHSTQCIFGIRSDYSKLGQVAYPIIGCLKPLRA